VTSDSGISLPKPGDGGAGRSVAVAASPESSIDKAEPIPIEQGRQQQSMTGFGEGAEVSLGYPLVVDAIEDRGTTSGGVMAGQVEE